MYDRRLSDDETKKTDGQRGRELAGIVARVLAQASDPSPAVALGEACAPVFEAGDLVDGRYRIVRFLARGGMGEVYHARDEKLGEDVALKTLRPDFSADPRAMDGFMREIQLARKVTHPNVSRVFDVAEDGEVAFYTMELLEGETLASRLARGRFTPAEALPVLEQLAAGLDAAHEAGIIHRDFKPANVLLVAEGSGRRARAVVADFGVARRSQAPPPPGTGTGEAVGTPAYMAPEQLDGGTVTARADVYALGTVAYEMVTGRRPFAALQPMAGLRPDSPPTSPRAYAPELDRVWEAALLRALAHDPARRFEYASDLVRALRGEKRRRLWLLPAGAVVALAAALTMRPRPPRELVERRLTSEPGYVEPAALSPDGKLVAFVRGGSGVVGIHAIASGETRRLALPDDLAPRALSWFPDGVSLLIAGPRGLHRASILGGEPTLVREGDVRWAAVSRAGDRIAFTVDQALWVMGAEGGAPRRVADRPVPGDGLPMTWGPGDHRIAFVQQQRGAAPAIRTVDVDGGITTPFSDPRLLLNPTASYLAWLPDGRILYALREDDGTSLWELSVDPEDGRARGEPRRRKVFVGASAIIHNASADGHALAYVPLVDQSDVHVAAVASPLSFERVTFDDREDTPVAFSADGAEIFFLSNRRGGVYHLFARRLAGAEDRELARGGDDFQGALAPDGHHLLVRRPIAGGMRLVQVPVDGGPAEERFDIPLAAGASMYSSRLRCGRAGCVEGRPEADALVFTHLDPARGLGAPFHRLEKTGAWDLDPEGRRIVVAEYTSGRLTEIPVDGSPPRDLGTAACPPRHLRWGAEGSLLYTCDAPSPALRRRTAAGEDQLLWSGDGNLSLLVVSPDGRRLAVGLTQITGSVWLLEGL